MYLSATEKLLKKNFGITSFAEVLKKLEKEPEETFSENLFVEKSGFIERIRALDKSIRKFSEAYSIGLEMAKPGSIYESFARSQLGEIRGEYIRVRKQLVHHLSFFYKLKT